MNLPSIGSFRLVQSPARLDIADKLIYPPSYSVQFSDQAFVADHQLSYLAANLNCDEVTARRELEQFGGILKDHLHKGVFEWNGLGTLELSEEVVSFKANPQMDAILQPIPAERVLRERPQPAVLVGDREVQAGQEVFEEAPGKKRSVTTIIGWILVFLSLAFIAYHFYKQGLQPSSTGNKTKIEVERSR